MGQYTGAILITLAIIALMIALILLGWRNRVRRQSNVSAPPATPDDLGADRLPAAEGQYVSTTTAGDWLDRIAVHQLGIRSNATLFVHDAGVLIARHGATDVFIPTAALRSVGRGSGMAGKFVEKDGLLVISWTLGDKDVDTGFRPRYHQELPALVQGIEALLPDATEQTSSPAEDKENQ